MATQAIAPAAAQQEGLADTLAPLILLWAMPLYIAGGFVGILQFKLLYRGLSHAASYRSKLWIWQQVRPGLKSLVAALEASLGPPHKLVPSFTHVLLVAVVLVIIVSTERLLMAARRAPSYTRR